MLADSRFVIPFAVAGDLLHKSCVCGTPFRWFRPELGLRFQHVSTRDTGMPGHVWKISTEVITWGSPMYGGSSSRVEHQLQGGALML